MIYETAGERPAIPTLIKPGVGFLFHSGISLRMKLHVLRLCWASVVAGDKVTSFSLALIAAASFRASKSTDAFRQDIAGQSEYAIPHGQAIISP